MFLKELAKEFHSFFVRCRTIMFLSINYLCNYWMRQEEKVETSVHLVLHPHWIATTFIKLGSWSPWGGFYSNYIHQGNKSDKERNIVRKS